MRKLWGLGLANARSEARGNYLLIAFSGRLRGEIPLFFMPISRHPRSGYSTSP
jgi:hypothetical protein